MGQRTFKLMAMINLDSIYNIDVLDGMQEMKYESVDLIVTDPPYLTFYASRRNGDKSYKFAHEILNDKNSDLISQYLHECYRVLKTDCAAYVFCSPKTVDFFLQESKDAGFRVQNLIVWDKESHTAGDLDHQFGCQYEIILLLNKGRAMIRGKRHSDLWRCPRIPPTKAVHQNQKPLPLIERCIKSHSDVGDIVFDGFMGSGTTAVAAINGKRHYIGFELSEDYYKIAQKRIAEAKRTPTLF